MADSLENIIAKLLQNSTNEAQTEGFREIEKISKDPAIIISLCKCAVQSTDPQVRGYAALLLRRRILKAKDWKKLPLKVKQGLKDSILEAFLKDNENLVRRALVELIGAMAKHELPGGKWPELMVLLNQSIRSQNATDREVALLTLSVMAKALGKKLKPHFKPLLSMFQNTLTDTSSIDIPFYTIKALTFMVSSIGSEELNLFQSLVPNVIAIIKLVATNDQTKACECLEIFDELAESEVAVLQPHIKSLVEMSLEIAACVKFDDELRIKAVNTVAYIIRLKKKTIMKQRLAQQIMEVLFPLMCQPFPNDIDDDDDIEQSLPSVAGQALDIMALHLPPAKFLPLLMHHLQSAFESVNPHERKAAFLALSLIAEGCSEYIRHKYLPIFIPLIIQGIKDVEQMVRNAALYAVGQYAEYLQPEISKYSPDLLPVLLEYLQQTCLLLQQGTKNPPSLTRTFYAVERFCENLEDIQPYLPDLMNCLTTFLTITAGEKSILVKELAIDAIGSVAASAKTLFVPYFTPVMELLKAFISEKQTDDTRPLQIRSIDTLAVIARNVGPETFQPLAHDCLKWSLQLMQDNDDPDIRTSCYGLFSSLSVILKEEMAPYLKVIVGRIMETMKSSDGVSISTDAGDNNAGFTLFEDDDDEGSKTESDGDITEDEEDSDDVVGYSVENSYVEEKEGALLALGELANEIGFQFLPYIEVCYSEVMKQVEHLSEDVRKTAVGTLGNFCVTLHKISIDMNNLECRVALEENLGVLYPKLFSLAREDMEQAVVFACLETLQLIVDKIQGLALNAAYLESMCLLIKDVFKNKLACQDHDESGEEDEQEAEYDNMLMEYAGELIASLVKVVPWNQFAPYMAGLMPFLLAKTKKACTVSEKSFSVGTLAEIVHNMAAGSVRPFIQHIQPVFLSGMKEDNEEVRSNAVYGIGVLAQNAGEMVYDQYQVYLNALSNMLVSEEDPRALDNICGAVARLIKTNINGVPLDTVFPVFLRCLPLKKDLDENTTVFECLSYLQSIRCEQFFQNIPQILKICSEAVISNNLEKESMVFVCVILLNIYKEFPAEFQAHLSSLPPVSAEAVMKAIS